MITEYVDVDPDDLAGNDAAHHGRLPVHLPCGTCRQSHGFLLAAGRWRLEHAHPNHWSATRVSTLAGVR